MTIQPQKVQYTYDNTTAKPKIPLWLYNCKKYNTRMTKPPQKLNTTRMTRQPQKVQYTYDNITAKTTIQVWQYNCKRYNTKYDITTANSTIQVWQ